LYCSAISAGFIVWQRLQNLLPVQAFKRQGLKKQALINKFERALNGLDFSSRHGVVFSFRYSISEDDYPPWRNLPKFNESPAGERSLHHLLQRFNDFDSRLLNFSQSSISRGTFIENTSPVTEGFATPGPDGRH
jgi:hypothetical protein